jgi:hypothetical protein
MMTILPVRQTGGTIPRVLSCFFRPRRRFLSKSAWPHFGGMEARRTQGRKDARSVLRLPTIRRLKAEPRQRTWNEAIKDVVKVRHERAVIGRLEKLLAA